MKRRIVVSLLALVVAAGGAWAQDASQPITWLAYAKTKEGKVEAAVKHTLENDKAVYDELMADGTLLGWGLATPINHRPDWHWNLVTWVTLPDWAAVDKWAGAAVAAMAARGEAGQAAAMKEYEEIFEGRIHWDSVVRNAHLAWPGAEGPAPRYFYSGDHLMRPGKDAAAMQLYQEIVVPIATKLQQEGAILGFGLHVQELHDATQWSHRGWYSLSDLSGVDKLNAAFLKAMTPETSARVNEVFDPSKHTDDVLMILHLGTPEPAPKK